MTDITPTEWFKVNGNEAQCLVCKFEDSCQFQCYPGLKNAGDSGKPACLGKGL
jgi:hypothetical protein